MLTVSFALAQSCALSVLEARVEESFETTRKHPQELAETGYVTLTKSAVSKLMGYICIVRSHVSVQAKLIDLPGFFTEHAEWEKVYSRAADSLEVGKRVKSVNDQVQVLDFIIEVLKDQISMRLSSRMNDYFLGLTILSISVNIIYNIILKDFCGLFKN